MCRIGEKQEIYRAIRKTYQWVGIYRGKKKNNNRKGEKRGICTIKMKRPYSKGFRDRVK
jgi:hypothetical protein